MTPTIVITGLVCLLVGAALGVLITRSMSDGELKSRELEDKLAESEDRLRDYQHEVTQHFVKTSELISNLTQSYREVHQHLASSAMQLANPEISRQMLEAGDDAGRKLTLSALSDSDAQAPRDYAPTVPGGVLSEDYGFRKSGKKDTATVRSAESVASDNDTDRDPTLKVG